MNFSEEAGGTAKYTKYTNGLKWIVLESSMDTEKDTDRIYRMGLRWSGRKRTQRSQRMGLTVKDTKYANRTGSGLSGDWNLLRLPRRGTGLCQIKADGVWTQCVLPDAPTAYARFRSIKANQGRSRSPMLGSGKEGGEHQFAATGGQAYDGRFP